MIFNSVYLQIVFSTLLIWLLLYIIKAIVMSSDIKKKKTSVFLPSYHLFYTDEKTEDKKEGVIYGRILTSKKYGIKGKPDYIYKHKYKDIYLPIELKSGKIGDELYPHTGDLLQLCAYFLLIEDLFGSKPKEGRLIYSDGMFVVRNSKRLRELLFRTIKEMRMMLETGKGKPNASYANCKNCLMKSNCDYSK